MTIDGLRINHDAFVVSQKNAVVAIVASSRLDDCAVALAAAGVDLACVNVLQGQVGADILDFDGTNHGFWAHAVRNLQKLGTASNERENYARALRDGQSVFIIHVLDNAEADDCARVLYEHGGRRMMHFGKHVAERLSY